MVKKAKKPLQLQFLCPGTSTAIKDGYKPMLGFDYLALKKLKPESVDAIFCEAFLHRVGGATRIDFFNECWRILKWNTQTEIVAPYWSHVTAGADPLSQWPPISELTFAFLSEPWRKANGFVDYPLRCDFEPLYATHLDAEMQAKSEEARQFSTKHYLNTIVAMRVTLIKAHRHAGTG